MTVCSFSIFFQESLLERELQISMNGRLIFSEGFIFRWKGHPIRVASAKRILTLKEKALPHRSIFKTFLRSVQHVYLMVDFKPLLDLSNF